MSITNIKMKTHYIIGIGRSGTTLLSKLLNQHQNCLTVLETDFVIFFYSSFKHKTKFTQTDFKLVTDYFELYFKLNTSVIDYFKLHNLHQDLSSAEINSYTDLIEFIYMRFNYLKKPIDDIDIIIDKKPSYSLHINEILLLNPDAKFIYLIRDYRANILSRKQSVERRTANIVFNAYRWLFFNKKINSFQKQHQKIIKEVKYEDLVMYPKETMNAIYDFLGLSQVEKKSSYYENQIIKTSPSKISSEEILNNRNQKTLDDIEKPIFKSRLDSWKEGLNKKEIELSEIICGTYGIKKGYTNTRNITSIKQLIIKFICLPEYFIALYDYSKEFILIKITAKRKLKRIKHKYKIHLN